MEMPSGWRLFESIIRAHAETESKHPEIHETCKKTFHEASKLLKDLANTLDEIKTLTDSKDPRTDEFKIAQVHAVAEAVLIRFEEWK